MVLWKGSKSTPFGDGPKGTPYGEEALCHFLLTTVWQSKIITPYLNLLSKFIEGKSLFSAQDMLQESPDYIIMQNSNFYHIPLHRYEQDNSAIFD